MDNSKNYKRTTAVLGAGAVLDFDYNGLIYPTSAEITKEVVNLKIQGIDDKDLNLVEQVYNRIVDVSREEYLRLHPDVRLFDPQILFEDLFEVIETLHSYNKTWNHNQYPFPLISALVTSDIQFASIDYYKAMVAIIKKIFEIVEAYDKKFREDDRELWYKSFWRGFDGKVDFFNLNYDTTLEYSLGDENYTDGFVGFTRDYERFDPEVLWNASSSIATVNHLHGCILYGDTNPKPVASYYSHRDLYKFYPDVAKEAFLSNQWLPRNQVGDSFFYSPIITGQKKTDKLCFMPHSVYHANLVRKILDNPSLLICGYSFGDLYVNQLLQRHKLIHGDHEKVVLIDKWPSSVNEDNIALYNYFMKHTSSGLREFVARIIEGGINPIESFRQFEQISDGCWQSPNGVIRLFTKGFKNAVEGHQDEFLSYLS